MRVGGHGTRSVPMAQAGAGPSRAAWHATHAPGLRASAVLRCGTHAAPHVSGVRREVQRPGDAAAGKAPVKRLSRSSGPANGAPCTSPQIDAVGRVHRAQSCLQNGGDACSNVRQNRQPPIYNTLRHLKWLPSKISSLATIFPSKAKHFALWAGSALAETMRRGKLRASSLSSSKRSASILGSPSSAPVTTHASFANLKRRHSAAMCLCRFAGSYTWLRLQWFTTLPLTGICRLSSSFKAFSHARQCGACNTTGPFLQMAAEVSSNHQRPNPAVKGTGSRPAPYVER